MSQTNFSQLFNNGLVYAIGFDAAAAVGMLNTKLFMILLQLMGM